MAIVIVFTIYKNGGNAGSLGASFSCAVFGVRGSSGGNAGAQLFGRYLMMPLERLGGRSLGRY